MKKKRRLSYEAKLLIRLVIAALLLFYFNIFYIIFTPLTVYPLYFFLKILNYAPILQQRVNPTIIVNNTALAIIPACVAGAAYALFVLLILLTKDIDFKKSIKIFLFGAFLILAMNVLRLMFLAIIFLNFDARWFDLIHLFLWKVVASAYVAFVWIFLIWKFKVKAIPIISDLGYLWENVYFKKSLEKFRKSKKRK